MIILDVRVSGIQRGPRADPWIRGSIPLLTFVALGLPAGAIGVAWPYMRASFGAPLAGLGGVLAAFTVADFLVRGSRGPLPRPLGNSRPRGGGRAPRPAAPLGL